MFNLNGHKELSFFPLRFKLLFSLYGPKKNDPSREFQDKADIQFLIETQSSMDWNLIKKYADLFDEWEAINEIKQKSRP